MTANLRLVLRARVVILAIGTARVSSAASVNALLTAFVDTRPAR
jgi:hypothetical protein